MKFKFLSIGAAALALAATPVLAEGAMAQRTGSPVGDTEGLAPAILIGVIATVAIVGGAVVIANEDDEPTSP